MEVTKCVLIVLVAISFKFIQMQYYDYSEKVETYMCGVSHADQELIIDIHNHFRWLIANGLVPNQPRGINLKRLQWDIPLAEHAQHHAQKGKFDIHIDPDSRFIYNATSQSIYLRMSTANLTFTNWTECLTSWFNEYQDYTFGSQNRSLLVYHYKQMVWANTSFVGCGTCSYYDDFTINTRPNYQYKTLMVCNYGPPGNLCDYKGRLFDPYKTNTTENETGCIDLCPSDDVLVHYPEKLEEPEDAEDMYYEI